MANNGQKMTDIQERGILEKYISLADTIDGHIGAQPPIKELDALDAWIREMQALSATLAEHCAQAEGFFALSVMVAVAEIEPEVWKRIGKSSTLTTQYVAGMYSKRYIAWQRLNNLKPVVKTIMDNTRTLMVSVRNEKIDFEAGHVRNSAKFPEDEK